MKFRVTPLNIVASLGFLLLALSFFNQGANSEILSIATTPLYRIIFACLILVAMVTDLIFRFLFKDLKRVWFVELIFITLTITIFLLLQK